MKLDQETIDKIKEYYVSKPEVIAVYLYGSFARGEAKADSDIDLAVLVEESDKYKGFAIPQVVFAQDLTEKLGREIEVQDLTSVALEFKHRVITEGILIYCNAPEKRIGFEVSTINRYFDLKPFYDEYYRYLSLIAKRGELDVRFFKN